MKKQNVVFDLGNVLVAYDWKSYLQSFSFDEETFKKVSEAMFLNEDWVRGDAGVPKEEWLDLFIENAPAYEEEIRLVYKDLGKCIYRYDYTLPLIHYFQKNGYRIFYLSNYSEGLYEKTKEQLSFIEDFDGGVFSYKEKCIKPDEKIYKILIERYQIKEEETLFFDDRKENIEAAEEIGMKGILVDKELVSKIRDQIL